MISATENFAADPNAQCPPSQAEINAGLGTCIIAVTDITATTATGAVPSQADFAGEALLDFSGQGTPQSPPTVSFNPPLAAAGHSATVSDAGASTNWWAGGWWAGGYPNGQLDAAPYSIPASNVLLNGNPLRGRRSRWIRPCTASTAGPRPPRAIPERPTRPAPA